MKEKTKDETAHVAGDTCLSRSYITCVEVLTDRFTKAYETRDSEVLAHEEMVSLLEDAKQTLLDDDFVSDRNLGRYLVGIRELFTAIRKWGVCATLPKYQSNLERACESCGHFETLANKLIGNTYSESEEQELLNDWSYHTSLVFSQLLIVAEAIEPSDTRYFRSYLDCVEFLEGAFEQAYESGDNEVLTHEGIANALKRVRMIDDAILELYGDAPEGLFDELDTHFNMMLYWIWLWGYAAGITKYQSVLKNVSDECKEVRENESLAVINSKEFNEECSIDIATRTYDLRQSLDKIFGSLLFIAEAMAKEKAARAHEPSKRANDGGGKASGKKYKKYAVSTWEMAQVMCGLENSRATLNELKKEIKTKKEAELSKEQRALKAMERTLRNAEVRLRDGKNIRLKATVNRMSVIYSLSLREDEGKAFTWARCYCAEQKIEKPKISYSGNLEGKLAIENLRAKGIPMPQNKNNDY